MVSVIPTSVPATSYQRTRNRAKTHSREKRNDAAEMRTRFTRVDRRGPRPRMRDGMISAIATLQHSHAFCENVTGMMIICDIDRIYRGHAGSSSFRGCRNSPAWRAALPRSPTLRHCRRDRKMGQNECWACHSRLRRSHCAWRRNVPTTPNAVVTAPEHRIRRKASQYASWTACMHTSLTEFPPCRPSWRLS